MNGLLYTPGQELAVLQKLQMVVSVEPTLLARADLLSVLQRILVRTLPFATQTFLMVDKEPTNPL